MITGIGTDLVYIPRMQRLLARWGDKAAARMLDQEEMQAFGRSAKPAAFLAKRFAAKEAAAKALGSGFRNGLSLRHIAVRNDNFGKPSLQLHAQARQHAEQQLIRHIHISLSDDGDYACAYVIMSQ